MGMSLAAELSRRLGLVSDDVAKDLQDSLKRLALPTQWPASLAKPEPEALLSWMLKDKKNQQSRQIRLILPTAPKGTVMIKLLDEPALLLTLWQDWLDGKLG